MAKRKYASSKIVLTCASFLAFGGISALVSIRGPLGGSAQAQAASVQSISVNNGGTTVYDAGRNLSTDSGQLFDAPSSGPVARSQGT